VFLKCLNETFSLLPHPLYRLFGVSIPKPEEKQPGVNPSDQTTGKVKMSYTYQRVWQRRTGMNGRVHTREFKLAIARQLASGEKRPAQICREHNLASSVVSRWRNAYEQRGEEAFQLPVSSEPASAEAKIAELERFCGQLALENALLKKALGKLPLNSGMR
jgi:transposase